MLRNKLSSWKAQFPRERVIGRAKIWGMCAVEEWKKEGGR